jgi:hypothetical protein
MSVAQDTYEQVNRIIREQGIKKQAAFQAIGEQTGKPAGTVAANYYRQQKKEVRVAVNRRGRRPRQDELQAALARLEEAVKDVQRIALAQGKQLASLKDVLG